MKSKACFGRHARRTLNVPGVESGRPWSTHVISPTASLQQLQAYIARVEAERNFDTESASQKCLLLGEELGELFKAVRKASGLGVDPLSETKEVAHELADILSFVLAIANRYQIDLGQAFVSKELINQTRTWTSVKPT